MAVTTKSGRALNEADLNRMADRAEAGFNPSTWRPRPGRPSLAQAGGEHSPRIAVRLPEALLDKVATRAASEGKSVSQVVRGLLEDYAGGPVSRTPRTRSATRQEPGRDARKP